MEPHATDRKTKGAKQQGELKIGGRLLTDEPHPLSMSLILMHRCMHQHQLVVTPLCRYNKCLKIVVYSFQKYC